MKGIFKKIAGMDGFAGMAGKNINAEVEKIKFFGFFDEQDYLSRYPDVAKSKMDPVEHYVRYGYAEGRSPIPEFDSAAYVEANPEIADTGEHPFIHFCRKQKEINEEKSRSTAIFLEEFLGSDWKVVSETGLFDEAHYKSQFEEWEEVEPLRHYLDQGRSTKNSPNAWFDSDYYLENNQDVKASKFNPFLHFCQYGVHELRDPSKKIDMVWAWVMSKGGDPISVIKNLATDESRQLLIRPVGKLSAREIGIFSSALIKLLLQLGEDARQQVFAAYIYSVKNAIWGAAEEAINFLLRFEPDNLEYKIFLVNAMEKQGRLWQAADVLSDAIALDPENADFYFRLADFQDRMGNPDLAIAPMARALELKPSKDGVWEYRFGNMLERAGRGAKAEKAYAAAIKKGKKLEAEKFGVGVFHQNRGQWKEAAEAYEKRLRHEAFDSGLYFKMGMALDRCYQWKEAEQAYTNGLLLDPESSYWHYRRGFVLERQEMWRDAADAYLNAVLIDKAHKPYWAYRAGYCLHEIGEFEQAAKIYSLSEKQRYLEFKREREMELAQTIESPDEVQEEICEINDPDGIVVGDEPQLFYRLIAGKMPSSESVVQFAKKYELESKWNVAIAAYRYAIERSASHVSAWHFQLATCLMELGEWEAACQSFRNARILKRAYGVDFTAYEKDKTVKALMEYREYWDTLPVQKNSVFYESYLGASMSCNPYAIFKKIVADSRFDGWQHVWVINDISGVPEEWLGHPNVIFIPRESDAYRRYLATAEYLINNVTFPYWFSRREEQKYLNTWHGTPLKYLGKRMQNEPMAHGNITRNFLHATHVISPNAHTSDALFNDNDIAGIYSGKLAETGYPRIDAVFDDCGDKRRVLAKEMGLEDGRPIVLYAPTWRGGHGKPSVDKDKLFADIEAMSDAGYQLIFRGHHFMESALEGMEELVATVPQHIDTCELLACVDVLVTDYSSIFFDFIPTGRPIIHYAYDFEEYAAGRGMYFGEEGFPGVIELTAAGVREQINAALAGEVDIEQRQRYEEAHAKFCSFEDGAATERVVEFFFHDDNSHLVSRYDDARRSVIFYNGLFPANGITASCLNLLTVLESEENLQISMLFEPDKVMIDPVRVEKFEAMPESVKKIARIGRMVMTPEEIWITNRFSSKRKLESPEMLDVLTSAYAWEYRRVFGDMKHDAVVNFEGYNAVTCNLLGVAPGNVRKLMYFHSDLWAEHRKKLPYLEGVFNFIHKYDFLVSVSERMSDVNMSNLSWRYSLDKEKFIGCENIIDFSSIHSKADGEVDEDMKPWLAGGAVFVISGRLSLEKDHAKLLRAFSKVVRVHDQARLIVMGDGMLRNDLEMLVDELGLRHHVFFAGLRMNPFPVVKAANCFVLSSNHEGQPMVLLEAMTLGKAIIATDIDGNRGVLEGRYGKLVENSDDGLANAMIDCIENGFYAGQFDADSYQRNALDSFMKILG
ncbi:hypothetical protein CO613_03545 [Lysobacteraceae bacterium NML07-0707]|nr:hypothetical protein CO613_03545 [Xanthomonadaceae bacterium NML07-0707]